jgi:hypothetical protein
VFFYGPNLTLEFGDKLAINMQYAIRTDSKVYFGGEVSMVMEDVATQGGFAEIIYSPKGDMSDWYLTVLGNWVDSDVSELNYSSVALHAGYLITRNVRLVGEYTYQFSESHYSKASLGFVAAF